MSKNALSYLLKKEWSMGNGQCPECYGVPEDWFPHPLYCTSDMIGHELSCKLAASIKELNGKPLYKGQSKLTGKFRFGLRDVPVDKKGTFAECFCMIPVDEPLSKREIIFRKVNESIMKKHLKEMANLTFGKERNKIWKKISHTESQ